MALDLPPISKSDIDSTGWEKLLEQARERTCFAYVVILASAIEEAEKKGDKKAAAAFRLLAIVSSLTLRSDNAISPFQAGGNGSNLNTPGIDDFSEENFDLLTEILLHITDAEMRARVGDMLWVKRRNHKAARVAIEAYLASARTLETHALWIHGFHRLERAIYLGLALGGAAWEQVFEHVNKVLTDSEHATKSSFFASKLLAILFQSKKGDPARQAELSELHARKSEAANDWPKVQSYWDLAAKFWLRSGDRERSRTASINAAESYFKEAESEKARSYSVAAHHVMRAIEAHRRIGSEKIRIDELHRIMLDYEKRSLADLKPFSAEIDVSEMVQRAKRSVQGKTFEDAIVALCSLVKIPAVADLRKEAESHASQFLYNSLFPAAVLDSDGKTVARRGPVRLGDAKEDEDALTAKMYENANFHRGVVASGSIHPASREIWAEHPGRIDDFVALVSNNPFVPPGREHIFAEGLRSGLAGELAAALHLLMPQVENSIRHAIRKRGALTSTVDGAGIQEERDLNTLLYTPQARDIFGENQLFELRGLLISRFGANLRNKMAHGLLSSRDCYSGQTLYFWWLTLRLVLIGHLIMRNGTNEHDGEKESAQGEEMSEEK